MAKMPASMARARLRRQWSAAMDWASCCSRMPTGSKGFDDGLAVFLEGIVLIGGDEEDLAGEAMFVGVDAGTLLTSVGCWPGCAGGFFGKLGVVPGDDVGHCLLFVELHLVVPLCSGEHGDIGYLGWNGGLRLA